MEDQHLYDETMLDIEPILENYPLDLYDGSPVDDGTFDALENDLLPSVMATPGEQSTPQDDQMMSPQYGDFIDPDMFLNGVNKRESESDCSSSSHRNTPSPSDSNKSFESYPSSGYESSRSAQVNNILFDSPPVSPESPPQIITIPDNNVIRVGAAQLPTIQKSSCPSNLAELKKIKLPPKGPPIIKGTSSGGVISRAITKKTIVLTAKDYQALVNNMQNQANNGTILIKATPTSAFVAASKDKPVLPRPAQSTDLLSPRPHIAPTVSTIKEKRPDSVQMPAVAPSAPLVLPSMESSVDERTLKRHQRMIKNRESAYLSRVRKKEYVTTLEQQIDSLTKENQYLKDENFKLLEKLKLKCSCATTLSSVHNISKQITPNVRKNTAIVLAMLFMVSLNFGPLGNLLNSDRGNQAMVDQTPKSLHHKRGLLWFDDSSMFNARNIDISLNLTNLDDLSRVSEEPFAVCPFYVNQTENIRLASELRRWIGEKEYKNLTNRDGDDMSISSFSEMFALKDTIDSMYQQMKDISSQMKSFQKRSKLAAAKKRHQIKGGKKGRDLQISYQNKARKASDLAFYYSGFSKKYAKFFEEIGRRDDTFYLVSFSAEHLLLPALAYNKTNRPKMSLMLPSLMDNATHPSDKVTLMQIDCEVMNTSMIQIREKTIPGDLLRAHGKPEEGYPKEASKRATRTAEFSGNNERNISSSGSNSAGQASKHPTSRPFFIQRMSEHVKNTLDLN